MTIIWWGWRWWQSCLSGILSSSVLNFSVHSLHTQIKGLLHSLCFNFSFLNCLKMLSVCINSWIFKLFFGCLLSSWHFLDHRWFWRWNSGFSQRRSFHLGSGGIFQLLYFWSGWYHRSLWKGQRSNRLDWLNLRNCSWHWSWILGDRKLLQRLGNRCLWSQQSLRQWLLDLRCWNWSWRRERLL